MSPPLPFADLPAPEAALVLGSGLGRLADRVAVWRRVPYAEVPGLTAPTVAGHGGFLTLGDWAGRRVLLFEGRCHYYEGWSWDQVTAPARVAAALGARALFLTNAAGGIRDDLSPGSLMALRDHLEWTRPFGWRHPGPGQRPSPYSPRLLQVLRQAAGGLGVPLCEGVYASLTGPCYETPAEINALERCGADAVGMSTAREIQTGHDLGLECAAVSCVTNRAAGRSPGPLNHDEVLATARAQSERLSELIAAFVQKMF